MTTQNQSFVEDSIWRPLIHVLPDQKAFLVHPGTTLPPTQLNPGWHWHWPLLNSIRQIHFNEIEFTFSANNHAAQGSTNDEAIAAVSQDHHLFTIQGSISLQLDKNASSSTLAAFNRHSNRRLIRPLIRQFIRQAVARQPSSTIDRLTLHKILQNQSKNQFSDYGILVKKINIISVERFRPALKTVE